MSCQRRAFYNIVHSSRRSRSHHRLGRVLFGKGGVSERRVSRKGRCLEKAGVSERGVSRKMFPLGKKSRAEKICRRKRDVADGGRLGNRSDSEQGVCRKGAGLGRYVWEETYRIMCLVKWGAFETLSRICKIRFRRFISEGVSEDVFWKGGCFGIYFGTYVSEGVSGRICFR